MGLPERKVHKLVDSPAVVSLTNAYQLTAVKYLTVPTGNGIDGISGRISCIRLYGDAHSAPATSVSVIVTYDQAGKIIWLNERTVDITASPFTGQHWGATIQYEILGKVWPTDCPEGTVSVFVKLNNGTATWNDCHFLWEN